MVNTDEVRRLVAAASAYDNRKAGEANLRAWAEAARRARWSFTEALEAIHEHYAESSAFVMPGTITQRIRENRRQPDTEAIEAAPPASEQHRTECMDWIRQQLAQPGTRLGRRPDDGQ